MIIVTKWFNVKGLCVPNKHYMVDISSRLEKMKQLIEKEEYFVINRGRQYGKTTTLAALERYLTDEYTVISMDFQGLGDTSFENETKFCQKFLKNVDLILNRSSNSRDMEQSWKDNQVTDFDLLSQHITKMCQNQKNILMIDEADKASNHRVFLNFLGMLRKKYQARNKDQDYTFHSVILAGVYDIKNIKLKMMAEGVHQLVNGERGHDSPWNIAENFAEEMAFKPACIAGMLADYELDHQTGMNTSEVSEEIYSYTSGYPFLVTRICEYIHERLEKKWSKAGVLEAVKLITEEPQPNTLFDDLFKNIHNNEPLTDFLYSILMGGRQFRFTQGDEVMAAGLRYAFIKVVNGQVRIHNKIFEIVISDYFIGKERREGKIAVDNEIEMDVVSGDQFNIELFFEKFNAHYQQRYAHRDVDFLEREAAFLFLFFLQPYLNGNGFYFLQAEPSAGKRMDVVIVYGGKEFIIELKIWKGQKRHFDGQKQLLGYMEKRGAEKGYLLTFDFRQKKEQRMEWIGLEGKMIFEVQV